jgi:Holliday junction DNA helicase RuvA
MIGSLRGTVIDRANRTDYQAELLVEVGAVGYRVMFPAGPGQGPAAGSDVFLYVHTHVREDALILYGFASRDQRDCFELLLGAHGVGPAVAVALLSVMTPGSLSRAVLTEDVDALTAVPGIGKKTAARLVVDLAGRLDAFAVSAAGPDTRAAAGTSSSGRADSLDARTAQLDEVRAALSALGYGAEEVRLAVSRLPSGGATSEMVRYALRELAGSR